VIILCRIERYHGKAGIHNIEHRMPKTTGLYEMPDWKRMRRTLAESIPTQTEVPTTIGTMRSMWAKATNKPQALTSPTVNRIAIHVFIAMKWSNGDIGHPKLFMVGKASAALSRPLPTVNNFVAASAANAGP
jgi:hypothetical protein